MFYFLDKGCELEYVTVEESFEISKYGEYLYDDIVLLLESDKKYKSLHFHEFRDFLGQHALPRLLDLDFHGNIFVMFGNSPSDFVRKLAGYSGVEIDPAGSTVVDHFTAVAESDNIYHTKFMTSSIAKVLFLSFLHDF